ncbi:MAG: porin family protein [Daejeonella sp.]
MKKIILVSCLMLIASTAIVAQMPSFTLGIKGGVNYSKLEGKDDFTNKKGILGYQVGAFARVGGNFYVQPEVYLGSKGNEFVQVQQDNNMAEVKGKVKFTTLDIPILLGTKLGTSSFNLRFMAGPVISFIVSEKTSFDAAYQNVSDYNNYKDQSLGIQGGAGVDVGNLTLDLRYEAGLSNISKSEKYDQKQSLFHLSLGYKLF